MENHYYRSTDTIAQSSKSNNARFVEDQRKSNTNNVYNNKNTNKDKNKQKKVSVADTTTKDDMEWHDKHFDRKLCIRKKIEVYVSGFTVHGLTRIFNSTRTESIFWLIALFSGTVLTVYVVYGLIIKYFQFGVYTEIRSKIIDDNFFPTVTFCEHRLFLRKYSSYCGVHILSGDPSYPINTSKSCEDHNNKKNRETLERQQNQSIVQSVYNEYWSNGYFNVTTCETLDGMHCVNDGYFRPMEHFEDECIRFNYAGNLSGLYTIVKIEFEYINQHKEEHGDNEYAIIATVHDQHIHELDLSKRVKIQLTKRNEIKLDKTEIKRLPAPYPSSCSDGEGFDIFPGNYSRHSCILSHGFIEDYKKCGDTLDYVRSYIPDDIKRKYKQKNTIEETIKCLKTTRQTQVKLKDICAFPCNELEFTTMPTFKSKNKVTNVSEHKYIVSFQYQHADTYSIMEEKAKYKWDQLACEIGGFLGLIIGASILSIVEILAYIFLVIINKFV